MVEMVFTPCLACGFKVRHNPETRPVATLLCTTCIQKGEKAEDHLASPATDEVGLPSAAQQSDSDPDRKEPTVADTDTVQDEKPAKKSTTKAKKGTGTKAVKAPKAPKAPKEKKARKPVEERRARGLLEADVMTVTNDFDKGKVELAKGEYLTPHRIAKIIQEKDGLDEAPSTGAVAAVLARWQKYGFAKIGSKPTCFKGYTKAGEKDGLPALKEKHAAKRKAARAAEKQEKESAAAK